MTVRNRNDMRSIMAGYGVWGDMTVTLKDGTKVIVPAAMTHTDAKLKLVSKKLRNKDFDGFIVLNEAVANN